MKNMTMKKNTWMRIASLIFVLTILSTCMVSGSFAKYATTLQGTSSATVAKFDLNVHDGSNTKFASGSTAATIDLFGTITPKTAGTVAADRIAPGCKGMGQLVLDATDCEVSFTMDADVTVTDNDIPLKFCVSTSEVTEDLSYATNADELAETIEDLISNIGTVDCNATNKTNSIYIYWIWNPASGNTADSALITDGEQPQFTIDVDVTATQVL